ncbi:MAG: hypothetical protein J5793_02370, partial [Clostridia bacterium]|nr:hypothetical protein [Clostridia bacterium]
MIIRNAIKSNIRARGRTLLFSALIIALAAMLTLSLGVRLYCSAVIDSADSSFRTVARIEYAGTEYPDSDAADPYAREAAKKVDAEGIASADGVTDYYPASSTAAVVRGLKSNSADSLYRDYAVLRAFKVSKPLYGLTYEPIDGTPEGDFY